MAEESGFIDVAIVQDYLDLGTDGAGAEILVNGAPRYYFEILAVDIQKYPELASHDGEYLVVYLDKDKTVKNYFTPDIPEEIDEVLDDEEDDEDEEDEKETALVTLRMLKLTMKEADLRIVAETMNVRFEDI